MSKIKMVISEMAIEPSTNSPIVILKESKGERTLLVWIGILEATAIASELEGIKFSRPMIHDLMKSFIVAADMQIDWVEISDLRDNTFYASIHFIHNGVSKSIDARPSDALALALRVNAPIYVAEEVMNSIQQKRNEKEHDGSKKSEKWRGVLESLRDEDFGKYQH